MYINRSDTTESHSPSSHTQRSTHSVVSVTREPYDYLAKVIIVGASSTGKSSLLHRLVKGDFPTNSSQTIGVEFSSRVLLVADGAVPFKLQLWDTAGQERFRSLTRSYYRGSAGVVLVFDVTNRESLHKLKEHWDEVRAMSRDPSAVIVGNKWDMAANQHQQDTQQTLVSDEEVAEFVSELEGSDGITRYIKTSALTGENMESVFITLAESILTKIELGIIDPENQSFGVQYGEIPNWGATVSSRTFHHTKENGNVVRRKATTLSLVDRSAIPEGKDSNSRCFC